MYLSLISDFISLFYPRYCLACAGNLVRGEEVICTSCWSEFSKTNFHLEKENTLKTRFYGKLELEFAFAYFNFVKSGKLQKLLHNLKYNNKPEIGIYIGKRYGDLLKSVDGFDSEVIIPIPLHKSKLKSRGYNQSDTFAEGLSEALEIPWYNDVVIRAVKSQTQTKKSRIERWQNVESVFEVAKPDIIEGKNVLLVDDVITTGATLEACAKTIEKQVSALSIATIAVA